jgi:hypothetical protein
MAYRSVLIQVDSNRSAGTRRALVPARQLVAPLLVPIGGFTE